MFGPKRIAKKLYAFIAIVIAAYFAWDNADFENTRTAPTDSGVQVSGDQILAKAFRDHTNDLQVQGSGRVTRVLSDDNEGSRHQRFILRLGSGQNILVAHNIDLAPKIQSLKKGDHLEFYGEYEWNSKGGVIHWTHHDPQARHVDGWLKHKGKIYK